MRKYFFLAVLVFSVFTYGQDDLLNELDTVSVVDNNSSSFKSLKIVNLESTKLAAKGDLYFIVSHRFDYVKNGFKDFFGLDNANTRLQLVYGFTKNFTAHFSRSGFQKAYEMAGKYKLASQKQNAFPFDVVGFSSVAVNTEYDKDVFPEIGFSDRLSYVNQVLVSRRFNDKLSLEIAPSYLHQNVVSYSEQTNGQLAMGFGGRYKLTNRWSINMDYVAHLNRADGSPYKNPLSIGVDLETGGHVFQMHFTNSLAMHEAGFIGNTSGDWGKSQFAFGFNLVRVF
jgi:hypothetical protein